MIRIVRVIGFALVALSMACLTEDPRGELRQEFFQSENIAGLGERCGPGVNSCISGTTCFNGVCLTDRFAQACTPSPCGPNGFCAARGESAIQVFCNCDSGFVWDGLTCVEDTSASFPDPLNDSGTSCPLEVAGSTTVPDTADCPGGAFCTEPTTGGDCYELFVELAGTVGGTPISVSVVNGSAIDNATCVREYFADGSSDGVRLEIDGALASTLVPGASSIVLDLSGTDAVSGGTFRVWPQTAGTAPQSDSASVDFTVQGGPGFGGAGIGGFVDIDLVTGQDTNDDDLLDDGSGVLGGSFYIAFAGGDFVTGAFVSNCGTNENLGPAP